MFILEKNTFTHKWVLEGIKRVKKISQVNSKAGLKSSQIRKQQLNERSTSVEQTLNKCSTKRSEDTISEAKRSEETRREESEAQAQGKPKIQSLQESSETTQNSFRNASPLSSLVSSPRIAPAATCPNHIVSPAQGRGHGGNETEERKSGRIGFAVEKIVSGVEKTPNPDVSRRTSGDDKPSVSLLNDLILKYHDSLCSILDVKTDGDITSVRNLTNWVRAEITKGTLDHNILQRILDMAVSSSRGRPRNPKAIFFSQLRKEFGYGKI
jgi:hypothetical protein